MTINSILTGTFLFTLLLSSVTQARTFYNTEGKSIEAEMVSVENDAVVMKLANGREAKVPLNTLSTADQNYVKKWWEENKNKITARDVKVSINQNSVYTKRPETKRTKKHKIKTSEMEFTFECEVDNLASKTISGITASYSVHKRINKRSKKGSSSDVQVINNTIQLEPLESRKHLSFTTAAVKCNNVSDSKAALTVRETVIGVVLTLSVNGKEILTQSHPKNLIGRIADDKKRDENKEDADEKRGESKDIADSKRDESNDDKGDRGDRERNERLKKEKKEREKRLNEEKAKRAEKLRKEKETRERR